MTLKDLNRYQSLKREIETLKHDIHKIKTSKRKYGFGVDVVMASRHTVPYNLHPVTITGYGENYTDEHKRDEYIKKLKIRLKEAEIKFNEINIFINSTDDSVIRQIIECRYIKNYSWRKTATEIYGEIYGCSQEDNTKKILYRFLDKVNKEKKAEFLLS